MVRKRLEMNKLRLRMRLKKWRTWMKWLMRQRLSKRVNKARKDKIMRIQNQTKKNKIKSIRMKITIQRKIQKARRKKMMINKTKAKLLNKTKEKVNKTTKLKLQMKRHPMKMQSNQTKNLAMMITIKAMRQLMTNQAKRINKLANNPITPNQ